MLFCALVAATVCLDQLTKAGARAGLSSRPPISLLGGVVRLAHGENLGAFMGLGSALSAEMRMLLFGVLAGLLLFGVTVYVLTARDLDRLGVAATSLVVGGGLSNLVDRVTREGAVTDFLNLGIGGIRTGVFNVADLAIVLGAAGLILSFWQTDEPSRTI
jgi:signal peptidase II